MERIGRTIYRDEAGKAAAFLYLNITAEAYCWHKQELFKGRGGLGGTSWAGWNIEENLFGINKISVTRARAMSETDFMTNTVFYCYPASMNSTNIPFLVRDAHLAQGIPALTPTAGRMKFGDPGFQIRSFDFNSVGDVPHPNQWPVRPEYEGRWRHSDMKDVAYFFNFMFYGKVIEKGSLK